MKLVHLALLAGTAGLAACMQQAPLLLENGHEGNENAGTEYYQFAKPIRRVAIIGAGVGGLIAHRELAEGGFSVHSFERDSHPGGNWHYTDEAPLPAPIPNRDISTGDYVPSLPPDGAQYPYEEVYDDAEGNREQRRAHRAPKPIWNSLTSNAPAPIQQIRELPWPVGTPWELPNRKLQSYIRAFTSFHGLNSNDGNPHISYNTRVELAEKNYDAAGVADGWTLTTKTLVEGELGSLKAVWRREHFDALVVATGRYNAPYVPPITGDSTLAARFPAHVTHSREYRRPEVFSNKTVLIIGAATSGVEIARELVRHAGHVYQSVRPETGPVRQRPQADFLNRLPRNVTLLGEIRQLSASAASFHESKIELINGTTITGIDHIIFATGFRYTYPFLPRHHNTSLGLNDTARVGGGTGKVEPIVTDGTHLRSLYLDAFYIPDPTLAFINANFGMQSFTFAEFVSLAIAKVWSRTADLPGPRALWDAYDRTRAERGGYGRHFQFLGAVRTREALRFFQGWLDAAAVKYGGKQIDALSKETEQINAVWTLAHYRSASFFVNSADPTLNLGTLGNTGLSGSNRTEVVTGTEGWAQDAVYNDWW